MYFQTESTGRELVWATSWGVSTRLIGALVMTHSDDRGLVLPPKVAPQQVVIVPITKGQGEDHDRVMAKVSEMAATLKAARIRVKVDDRQHIRPGAKYFEWERKGVPLRIDIGARDLSANIAVMSRRNKAGEKEQLSLDNSALAATVHSILDEIHASLFDQAQKRLAEKTFRVSSYAQMKGMMASADEGEKGFYLVPWKCDAVNEEFIKEDCKATVRCYPDEHNAGTEVSGLKCFYSGEPATHMAIFARAF